MVTLEDNQMLHDYLQQIMSKQELYFLQHNTSKNRPCGNTWKERSLWLNHWDCEQLENHHSIELGQF
ncbi:unnamed protein product [Schistosoma margrebowiei]|uniref:Uncharacterized protein n=1 Tax=Schistosoma margrebowiei TaxID=48269 RepID=A0A183LGE9_9TREM|nr:unnamed protein product [Schistosoma margrebowiei]